MREFTRDLINEVRQDFMNHLDNVQGLCSLRDLSYAGGSVPDYSRAEVRQLYLLRYLPAYIVEYYTIYKRMLDWGFLQQPLSVLSIGVGCGVDFYALHHVLRDRRLWPHGLAHYVGVDRVDWGYGYNYGHPGFVMQHADILELPAFGRSDTNVIVFPKSIGELSEAAFSHILRLLHHKSLESPRVVVLNSLRESFRIVDEARALGIVNTLRSAYGYQLMGLTKVITHEREGLNKFSRDFYYPTELRELVTSLFERCRTRSEKDELCNTCVDKLNRWPILRTDHMAYQVLCLEIGSRTI